MFTPGAMSTYVALQGSDLELVKRLAGLVAVADILKGLGGVLAGNVEEDLLTTAVRIARVRIMSCATSGRRCGERR
jgi:hypothetical protein